MSTIRSPLATSLRDNLRQHSLFNQSVLLNGVDIQPCADMPRNMAMKRPYSRVVCVILKHKIPGHGAIPVRRLHQLHVSSLGVMDVLNGAIPGAGALGEDVEVVAVKVHGMRCGEMIADNDADGGITAEVVHVPLRVEGIGEIALIGED